MKKIFVILMAAMVFLASCSGEKLTYEENCDYGVKAMEKGDYTVAIGYFIETVEMEPDRADAYLCRAMLYEKSGDFNSAVKDYEKAIEIDSGLTDAYEGLAGIYKLRGRTEAAEEILKASYLENESEILLAGLSEAETSGTVIPLAAGIVG